MRGIKRVSANSSLLVFKVLDIAYLLKSDGVLLLAVETGDAAGGKVQSPTAAGPDRYVIYPGTAEQPLLAPSHSRVFTDRFV